MTSIRLRRHAVHRTQQLPALLGHDDDLRGNLDDSIEHGALRAFRFLQNRVQRRDDRHHQLGEQSDDVPARLAAEDAELVLQAGDLELILVEKIGCACVGGGRVIVDLELNDRGILVRAALIVHCHDGGFDVAARCADRLLQIGCKSCDPAAARQ